MHSAEDVVDRLTREGLVSLFEAAKANGISKISPFALHRACMSGGLESVKVAGRRLTSTPAFRRWLVARSVLRRAEPKRRAVASRTTSPAARAYLASKGLSVGGANESLATNSATPASRAGRGD